MTWRHRSALALGLLALACTRSTSSQEANAGPTQDQGTLKDVPCNVQRPVRTKSPNAAGDTILTDWVRLSYEPGAFPAPRPIGLHPPAGKNGVRLEPDIAAPVTIWLNYAICAGELGKPYYFVINNIAIPVRTVDDTWAVGTIVPEDGLTPLSPDAEPDQMRGFVILSN